MHDFRFHSDTGQQDLGQYGQESGGLVQRLSYQQKRATVEDFQPGGC